MKIKLKYVDFWKENASNPVIPRYIEQALAPLGQVELSDQPDFVVCSCMGREVLQYDCTRILFIGENQRPDFNLYDYAIGGDWMNLEDRFFRMPWYLFPGYREQTRLALKKHELTNEAIEAKTGFCSFVVSNYGANPRRERTFEALSAYKRVESGGRSRNNQPDGKPVENKLEFLSKCRFNLAFENACTAGYCTEKILDAFAAGTVPIYWGDPAVGRIYNPEAFISCNECTDERQVVEKVRAVEENPEQLRYMLRQPAFRKPEQVEAELENDPLAEYFRYIVGQGPQDSRRRSPDFWMKNYEDKERQLSKLARSWWFPYYAKGERFLWRRKK